MGRLTAKDLLRVAMQFAVLSVYVAFLLALTDRFLARFLPDYQFSGRYVFGTIIFFVAGTSFTLYGYWRHWKNWRYFIIGALAVFFPLVFLASTIRLFIGGEESMIHGYVLTYCDRIDPDYICGEAFAASVFTMSLRALPTVITAPALYWYILFYRPAQRKGRSK